MVVDFFNSLYSNEGYCGGLLYVNCPKFNFRLMENLDMQVKVVEVHATFFAKQNFIKIIVTNKRFFVQGSSFNF